MTSPLKPWADIFHISNGKGNEKLCFCSNRIGSLVAMATYSSHRLIMGKEEIDNFSVSMGIFGFFFTEMFISSPEPKAQR